MNPNLLDKDMDGTIELKGDFHISWKEVAELAKKNGGVLTQNYYWVDKKMLPCLRTATTLLINPM